MVDRETFDARMAKLEELLRRLRRIAETDRNTFLEDIALQAQAERWLQVAAECSLDLGQHLIASRGWRTPSSYRETFRVLREEGALSPELAAKMEEWAGLRNVLVHVYLEVQYELLYGVLIEDLDSLAEYAAALAGLVE